MAKARILIVEDEFLVAHDISDMLIELGYEVAAIVSTAEDALAVIRNRAPDLILLDIRLKGPIDGIQAANIIKEEWSIPFIYLTAHADDLTLARAKSSDPLGYLLKPFEFRELKTVIELAFYKYEKERQAAFWAIHDRLSGLPNKFLFLDHLSKAIYLGDRHHKRIAILSFVVLPPAARRSPGARPARHRPRGDGTAHAHSPQERHAGPDGKRRIHHSSPTWKPRSSRGSPPAGSWAFSMIRSTTRAGPCRSSFSTAWR